jgi:uncharacterized protein with HEPN domain
LSSRHESDFLGDIVENIDAITEYVAGMSFDEYRADRMTVDAVERCLARITEAAIRVGPARMDEIAPGLPMQEVRGLGNLLRHAYFVIDHGTIWSTIENSLPPLRAACERAMSEADRQR